MPTQPTIELRDATGKLHGKIVDGVIEFRRGDKVTRFSLADGKEVKKSRSDLDKGRETR